MKIRWIPAFAVSLGTIGAPAAAPAAGDDETSGTGELRSTCERAVKRVEASDHDDALELIGKLNRKESGNSVVLNMIGPAHRGITGHAQWTATRST